MKAPDYRWCDEEALFFNSIKNKSLWVDSFFMYAIIWAFGSILNKESKQEFDHWLKKCFEKREKEIKQKEMAQF